MARTALATTIAAISVCLWGSTVVAERPEAGIMSVALSHSGEQVAIVVNGAQSRLLIGPTDGNLSGFAATPMSDLDLGRRFRVSTADGGPRAVENDRWLGDVAWLNDDRLLLDVWSTARVIRARETGDFRRPVVLSSSGAQIAEWPGAWELAYVLPDAPNAVLLREARNDPYAYNHTTMEIGPVGDDQLFGATGVTSLTGVDISERLIRVELPDDDRPRIRTPGIASPFGFDASGALEIAFLYDSQRVFWFHGEAREEFVLSPGEMWNLRPIADDYPPHWTIQRQPLAGLMHDGDSIPYAASPASDRISLRAIELPGGERADLGWDGHPDQFGGFVVDWRNGRVIGFDWIDEAASRVWLDPQFAGLQSGFEDHFPSTHVEIRSWDLGMERVVARVLDDSGLASWHLWDSATEQMTQITIP